MADNLLVEPSFETDTNGDGIADGWLSEKTTATAATYSLVPGTVSDGGAKAQRMQYAGEASNTGHEKVEWYQAIGGFSPGETVSFEVWLSGAVSGSYVQLALEAHQNISTYLSEVNIVCPVGPSPQPYRLTYANLPELTDTVVIACLTPELQANASVDVVADAALLIKGALPALVRRSYNWISNPRMVGAAGSVPNGWSTANSAAGALAWSYPAEGVNLQYASPVGESNKLIQIVSPSSGSGAFAPGDTVEFSVETDGTMNGVTAQLQIQFLQSSGAAAGTSTAQAVTIPATAGRVSTSAVAPANTSGARGFVRFTTLTAGDSLNVNLRRAMLGKGSGLAYADGNAAGYAWAGAANSSVTQNAFSYPTADYISPSSFRSASVAAAPAVLAGALIVALAAGAAGTSRPPTFLSSASVPMVAAALPAAGFSTVAAPAIASASPGLTASPAATSNAIAPGPSTRGAAAIMGAPAASVSASATPAVSGGAATSFNVAAAPASAVGTSSPPLIETASGVRIAAVVASAGTSGARPALTGTASVLVGVTPFASSCPSPLVSVTAMRAAHFSARLAVAKWAARLTLSGGAMRRDSTEPLPLFVSADVDFSGDAVEVSLDNGATYHPAVLGEGVESRGRWEFPVNIRIGPDVGIPLSDDDAPVVVRVQHSGAWVVIDAGTLVTT